VVLNTTLWGDILPGGPLSEQVIPGIDVDQVIEECLPSLHAATRAELGPWTAGNLLEWLDEGLKRLSVIAGVFITRATTLTVPAQPSYASPPRHISTLHVSLDAVPLRPAGTLELEARDAGYLTTAGTPDHWYQDLLGMNMIGLAPVPDAEQTMASIYESWPETVDAGGQNTLVPAPGPLKGYLAMYLLAEAYGREGEMEMPDVAQHCRARLELYHQIFQSYYGKGN
jgi:hypothetical protein